MSTKMPRSNLWVCVIYPGDSLPNDYKQIIKNWHIPVLLSPVHDSDKNADDTEKKKHIHLMIDFGSGQNKAFHQVEEYTKKLNGSVPIICHSRNAMIRYFVHKDNPEKHQYDIDELECYNGFDIKEAFQDYTSEIQLYRFIENIIYDNMIYNYAVLIKYMEKNNLQYELQFVRKHTVHFSQILNGQWQLLKSGKLIVTDKKSNINKYVYIKDIEPLK